MLGTNDFIAATEITRRQAEWWFTKGYLVCNQPFPGSGTDREIPDAEVKIALKIKKLLDLDIKLPTAARLARENPENRDMYIYKVRTALNG